MSIENHQNIHAAGLTVDIIEAFKNRLRGKAALNLPKALSKCLHEELVNFVTKISECLDKEFE